jgi:NADH dehydrogenase
MSETQRKRILILGGGFGGMYVALHLEKALAHAPDVDVTIINRDNFFLFTPMLHEIAASDLDLTHIVNPVRKLLRKVDFFAGDVEAVDLDRKLVTVSHGFDHHHHDLPYDYLVIALGSITNFFGLPGLEERAMTVKSLGDAIHLRNRIIQHLEEADTECAAKDREPLLTFVVAGGGFAGVETMAAIHDFVLAALPYYRNLRKEMMRTVVVHPGNVILPELGEKLGRYAQGKLSMRGVEIRCNTKVTGVDDRTVTLSDGTSINSKLLIWTAGTSPNPILDTLPCKKERGRLVANECLELPDYPGVWALGDCAVVPDLTTGKSCPPTAQHALREGTVCGKNIVAALRGGEKKQFKFKTLGLLAAIGRRAGVAQMLGFNFSGFIAWFLWRTIYLSKLPRFEKKVRVALDWTLDLIFSKDLVQFMTFRAPTISHAENDTSRCEQPKAVARV